MYATNSSLVSNLTKINDDEAEALQLPFSILAFVLLVFLALKAFEACWKCYYDGTINYRLLDNSNRRGERWLREQLGRIHRERELERRQQQPYSDPCPKYTEVVLDDVGRLPSYQEAMEMAGSLSKQQHNNICNNSSSKRRAGTTTA